MVPDPPLCLLILRFSNRDVSVISGVSNAAMKILVITVNDMVYSALISKLHEGEKFLDVE
jgi:hypothetical protein